MRCPKCGYDNPGDAIFCEECDHRIDQPVRRDGAFLPPMYAVIIALALGVAAVICFLLTEDMWYLPVCLGAIGLVLGSYSLTVIRRSAAVDNKTVLSMFAGAAMALSVVGFVMGMTLI
jgi:predicted nucleic acid-binding Zn ribbon protein